MHARPLESSSHTRSATAPGSGQREYKGRKITTDICHCSSLNRSTHVQVSILYVFRLPPPPSLTSYIALSLAFLYTHYFTTVVLRPLCFGFDLILRGLCRAGPQVIFKRTDGTGLVQPWLVKPSKRVAEIAFSTSLGACCYRNWWVSGYSDSELPDPHPSARMYTFHNYIRFPYDHSSSHIFPHRNVSPLQS